MKTVLFWIMIAPLALVALVFLISNRGLIEIDLWPFPALINPPLSIVILASVFIGFLLGGFVAWTSAGPARRQARINIRRVKTLERELDRLHEQEQKELEQTGAEEALPVLAPPSSKNAA